MVAPTKPRKQYVAKLLLRDEHHRIHLAELLADYLAVVDEWSKHDTRVDALPRVTDEALGEALNEHATLKTRERRWLDQIIAELGGSDGED